MRATLAEVLRGLGSEAAPVGADRLIIGGVAIDSRRVQPGDLFVALRGERTDGFAYVSHAFAAGAVAALVDRPIVGVRAVQTNGPQAEASIEPPVALLVPDTLLALQRLARWRREGRPDLRVVGVTGSVGKTTTKECIAAVLQQRYEVLRSAGNYNNEIGLPLTLMELSPQHQRAVLEMGMYALGEIAALCRIAAPQVGVVVNVLPVHLERLGTIAQVARAKAELVEALPRDGMAVLNGDDPLVSAMSSRTSASSITYGCSEGNAVRAEAVMSEGLSGVRFTIRAKGWMPERRDLRLATLGRHSVMAATAAVAVGLLDGLSWEEIQKGLLGQGRGVRLVPRRGWRGSTLLDDSYNSSPTSALAALALLTEVPGRRIGVLGDMLELGSYESEGHCRVGQRCAEVVAELITVGQRGRLIADAAVASGLPRDRVQSVEDAGAAITVLTSLLREGDVVLIKGSRGMAMESIVQALALPETTSGH